MSLKAIKKYLRENNMKYHGVEGIGLDYKKVYFYDELNRGKNVGGCSYTACYYNLRNNKGIL